MEKLVLLDANSLFHRAFHAVRPLFTKEGVQVNAVYGFSSMLLNILETQKPDFIIAAFDKKKKTFRHDEYPEYKATRVSAPDELYAQIPLIKKVLESMDIPIFAMDGYEADDILGTISEIAKDNHDTQNLIFSSDHDVLQLVNEKTLVARPGKAGQAEIFDSNKVKKKIGVLPAQIPDFKGLSGDSSDNIPGVLGIGPKTASSLLNEYGTLEDLLENTTELKGKIKQNIERDREKAILSKKLATILKDIPLDFSLEKSKFPPKSFKKAEDFFDEIQSKSLKKRVKKVEEIYDVCIQGCLF